MNSKAARTNISLSPQIRAMADMLMAARAFSDFSGFLSQLIREEWERRQGPVTLPPQAPAGVAPSSSSDHAESDASAKRIVDTALRGQLAAVRRKRRKV